MDRTPCRFDGKCSLCGGEAERGALGNWRAYCMDCRVRRKREAGLQFYRDRIEPVYVPVANRPMCACNHFVSLHVAAGCAVCVCAVAGTGVPDITTRPVVIHLDMFAGVQVA